MRFDLVINLFIAQAISSKKITVHGGSQYRPFLHVQDAANALIFALEKDLTGTFNAISKNYTILEAANKISDATGCEIETANEMEDPRNYNVSGKKMEMMGFTPQKRIEDAIEEIRDYILESKIDYKDKKYSNYELLFSSKEMQEKVFLLGI
jgi:nucleoside-diphosphate-sugar epimerase